MKTVTKDELLKEAISVICGYWPDTWVRPEEGSPPSHGYLALKQLRIKMQRYKKQQKEKRK